MLYDKEGWSNNTEGSFKEDFLGKDNMKNLQLQQQE